VKRQPPSVALVSYCAACGYFGRVVTASQASQLVVADTGETPECQWCVGVRCDVLRFEYVRTVARATRGPLPFDYPSRLAKAQGGKR
jgi:hypothetical protein